MAAYPVDIGHPQHRSAHRWREAAAHVTLAFVAGALFFLNYLHYSSDLEFARRQFESASRESTRQVALQVSHAMRDIYQGLRTVARLPGVQAIGRYGKNLDPDARQAIQEVYNNLANNVTMSEVYIVPAGFDPDKIDPVTGRLQEPILTFDEFIVGRTADDAHGVSVKPSSSVVEEVVEEIEIYEWRVMREQLAWLGTNYSTIESITGLSYPAVGGPEVLTCDNTRYSPVVADDAARSGLVYSVPFFDAQGAFKGVVSGVILSLVLSDMLPTGSYALHNAAYGYTVWPNSDGQALRSEEWVRQGIPDPRLVYSEVIPLENPDRGEGWVLWAGQPDQAFASMPEVRANRMLTGIGYIATLLGALLGAGIIRVSLRQRAVLESRVAQRTAELGSAMHSLAAARDNERRFTGDAAHELRTPLAAIKTQAQVALRASAESTRDRALSLVVDSVSRTTRLVDQLLTLARMDPMDASRIMRIVDLTDIATRIVAELSVTPAFKHRRIAFTAVSEIHVLGDQATLEVLIRNLVDNALRYSGPDGDVDVSVDVDTSLAILEVADKGPGIPVSQRDRVKDRFYRVAGSGVSGAGLGLSIVHRIVELHGARMEILGPPERAGTLVRVVLQAKVQRAE